MLENQLESIHVMPGLFCNYSCSHCVNNSGPKMTKKVSSNEIQRIQSDIKEYKPKSLQFSGGESSFYYQEINQIVSAHPDLENCEVILTSNGWYGKTLELTEKTLDQFDMISQVTLSFDVFHGNEAKIDFLENIKKYAKERNIKLVVSFCISSPLDLIKAKKVLGNIDIPVIYQKVDSVGRAKENQQCFKFPVFEENTLDETCPNIECISFIPDKGFSICCGNLMFNGDNPEIYHETISDHFESPFYKRLKNQNFGQILEEKNILIKELKSKHSSACALCEFIHCGGAK
jgi:MoaA/NifB/PqqE/SkfB family radical SAM enzyme